MGMNSPNQMIFGSSEIFELPQPNLITPESDVHSKNPSMVIDDNNNIHVVWAEKITFGNQIYYKKWSAITQTWGLPQNISTSSDNWLDNPRIAIDSSYKVHIVWEDSTDYDHAGGDYDIFYNTQILRGWGDTVVVSDVSTSNSRNPSIAIDSGDNIYICWEDLTVIDKNGADSDIIYKYYDYTARSWSSSQVVSKESTAESQKPDLAIDSDDNISFVWYDVDGSTLDIMYKKGYTAHHTWDDAIVVSTDSTSSSFNPVITIDIEDNIHIIWVDYTDYEDSESDSDIFYKKWSSSDQTWGITEVVSVEDPSTGSSSGGPCIAIDSELNVHVAWSDMSNLGIAGTDYDIFYRLRNATTDIWGNTEIISITSYEGSSYPDIGIDSEDYFHIIWTDYTDITGSGEEGDLFWLSGHPRSLTETVTETETEIETETQTDTETNVVNQTDLVTSIVEETTTVTDAKSELPVGAVPFLTALALITIIIRRSKNKS